MNTTIVCVVTQVIESQKGLGWKESLKAVYSNPPAVSRDIFKQVVQSLIHPDFDCFQGWGLHQLSGQSFPFLYYSYKNVFLVSSLNLPSFSLRPLPLVLLLQVLLKVSPQSWSWASTEILCEEPGVYVPHEEGFRANVTRQVFVWRHNNAKESCSSGAILSLLQ